MTGQRCLASLSPVAPAAVVPPDAVEFNSRGVALVIGDGPEVAVHARTLAGRLRVVLFAPGVEREQFAQDIVAVGGRVTSVRGHLGAFRAEAAIAGGGSTDIGRFGPNADATFDLVLDLGTRPAISMAVPPLGYFAPGADDAEVKAAILTMAGLVGRFTKPRYFEYTAGLCAHGASGVSGCVRCLDVCSTGAIRSAGNRVEVDPFLCQGCATCSLACPTGALEFRAPPRESLADRVARAIASSTADPVVVVHGPAGREAAGGLGAQVVTIEVAALPAFGEELWFWSLAQGAAGVVLLLDAGLPHAARALLEERIGIAQEVLGASGMAPRRIAACKPEMLGEALGAARSAAAAAPNPGRARSGMGKRAMLLSSIDAARPAETGPGATLPPGAAFGEVIVARAKCTLCLACANLCPTAALTGESQPVPILRFDEAACIQCGICEKACPEKAITLAPRFAAPSSASTQARVLHEDDLVGCSACGTPFISRGLLAASLGILEGHPELVEGAAQRLRMCPACRQRSMIAG